MSAMRGYAEVAADLAPIEVEPGANTPTLAQLERMVAKHQAACREAAALLAGVAAALPEGVTVEQVVAENARLRELSDAVCPNCSTWKMPALDTDLLPDCPTCGGTQNYPHLTDNPCEDCTDGKVTGAQMAALWQAVWDDASPDLIVGEWGRDHRSDLRAYLRSVRPPSPKEGT